MMTYQLMKFTLTWKLAVPITVLVASITFLDHRPSNPVAVAFPLVILFVIAGRRLPLREPCTVFEASLPIHARQIFCARVIALLAFVWLPVLAAVAVNVLLGGSSAWTAAEVDVGIGSVFTVLMLSPLCIRVGSFTVSGKHRGLIDLNYVISFTALISSALVLPHISVVVVMVIFFTATASLLGYAWARIPASFQIVSAERGEGFQQEPTTAIPQSSRTLGILVWAPLLRTLSLSSYAFLFAVVPMLFFIGPWAWPILTLMFAGVFLQIHFRSHWLFTLPISRHKLFATLSLPLLGVLIGGCALNVYFRFSLVQDPQLDGAATAKMALTAITAMAASSLLAVLLVNFAWWHRIGRTLRITVPSICVLALVYFMVFGVAQPSFSDNYKLHHGESMAGVVLVGASRILPNDMFALAGIAVIFVGGLYWLASKQFSELEVSSQRLAGSL
jgi:hypothetical protein